MRDKSSRLTARKKLFVGLTMKNSDPIDTFNIELKKNETIAKRTIGFSVYALIYSKHHNNIICI